MRATGKNEVYASVSPKFGPCHAIANGSTRGRRPVMRVTPQKGGTGADLPDAHRAPGGDKGQPIPPTVMHVSLQGAARVGASTRQYAQNT